MKFGVLGPLTVTTSDGVPITVGGARLRTLLAVLLFHAGNPISVGRLVDTVWDGAPPKSHLSNLHTYISRLRDRLDGVRIDHFDGQFCLYLPPDALDLLRFRREAEAGRLAVRGGDPAAAAEHFRAALAQWRDRPLPDLSVPGLEAEITELEATRLNLVEECFAAELATGRGGELVGELQAAVAEHPTRERLCGQLMTALCEAGRQADALAVYRTARATLVDALGVEPGPELRQLHEKILRGEPPRLSAALRTGFPICQLPPDVADFSGRAPMLDELTNVLRASTSTVPVVVLTGKPGVGKTALAMRVAHQLRSEFPDGQLFTRLTGATREPKQAHDTLAGLLRATGASGASIPDDPEERAALFRARLADRRVLVVLDDAASPHQVRPLLPGTPGCAVLVSSRTRLSGLAGVQRFAVLPFTDDEARHFLERVAGPARVGAEPVAASRVAAMCGNLPLALRIAATRLATRPQLSLRYLARRLGDERHRLDELAISDLQVRASLAVSYDALTPLGRKAFRRMSLLGPHSVPGWVVAVLLDAADADGVLEELVEASLLDPAGSDAAGEPRYRMHDLLRVFGAERAETEDTESDRLGACRRVVDAALAFADAAARRMPRTFTLSRLNDVVAAPAVGVHDLIDDPVAWFTAEQSNLIHLVRMACARGWHREAALLAERLDVKLWSRSEWAEMRTLHEVLRGSDERTAARAEFVLTLIDAHRGHHDQVAVRFERCCKEFERLGDLHALACALSNYAHFLALTGEAERSLPDAERAIELFRAEGDGFGEAAARRSASITLGRLGRLTEALAHSERALALARELNEDRQIALALSEVAWVRLLTGELSGARTAGTDAVTLFRALGERSALANTLYDLGLVEARLGHRDGAVRCFEESGQLASDIDERPLVAATARGLAAARIGTQEAVSALRDSLEVFRELAVDSEQTITLHLLADALDATGSCGAGARAEADRLADRPDLVTSVKLGALLALSTED
ncbi:AfsR/SARP family transcriptional regulator [Lentzea flava]|uniref:SARP family transcriptional regulator n=1 Tax=Lentzea flava TaxID=103732 RepID=A0ABQ2UHU1_9PSEU|nr:BTAD domain-containing putative transcriptional regulator [Lentzea flava]MCP2199402.1 DNA-binding transcriptional activator of the SARP family [Lentzea flava]GGU35461.1 SARP family transcriptional regulator [Lentzea flava]